MDFHQLALLNRHYYTMSEQCSSSDDTYTIPVTNDYMQAVLREYEQNDTFIVKMMSSKKALSLGENLLAEVFRVQVDGEITIDGEIREYTKSVIVKKPFRDDKNTPPEMFKFESKVYNNVLVAMEKVFKHQLPVIRAIKAEENIVITEDFKEDGWTLTKYRDVLTDEQLVKIVKSLAMFHAASITLSKSEKIPFTQFSQYVQDQVFAESNAELCKKTLADAYAAAKYFTDEYLPKSAEDQAIKRFFSQTSDDLYNKAKQVTAATLDFAKILVHGECWANNFMLKEDNSGDYALLINLETVCLTSPARDLVYLFATNPQAATHKAALIHAYVEELHRHLREHDIKSDVINQFSMEFIKSEVERLKPLALLIGLWLLVPMSFKTYPSVDEYNALARNDKPQLIAKHIDKEFYVSRLMDTLIQLN